MIISEIVEFTSWGGKMSKFLGGAVLAVGVGALGWYGNGHQAEEMQTRVTDGAAAIAQTTVHGVSTRSFRT